MLSDARKTAMTIVRRWGAARRLIVSLALLALCAPASTGLPPGEVAPEGGRREVRGEEYYHRIKFDRLTLADGLSQVSGNAILQDSKGFIWIGTQDGLNRHDGYRVEVFKHDPADPDSLAGNYILGLYQDRRGRLWIVSSRPGVVSSFDFRTERFRRFVHDPRDPASLAPSQINPDAVHLDEDGDLWLGTCDAGVAKLDPATGRVSRWQHHPEDESSLSNDRVTAIIEDGEGRLWIATDGGGLNRRLAPGGAAPGETAVGETAVAGEATVARERFARLRHDPDDPASLSHDGVLAILEDRAGALWVGTRGGGLNRLGAGRDRGFERVELGRRELGGGRVYVSDHCPEVPGAEEPRFALPRVEDSDGRLWIVTDTGLASHHPAGGDTRFYRHDPEDPRSLSSEDLRTVHQDRTGALWIATWGGGLDLYDPVSDDFVVYIHDAADATSLSDDFVDTIYEDRSGILWLGTDEVSRFSRRKHKFEHFRADPRDSGTLTGNFVYALYEDRAGGLWVGTAAGGLHRFDQQRQRVVERFFRQPGSRRDLGSDWVRAIIEDRRGRFWVGTSGAGLVLLDRQRGEVVKRYRFDRENPASLSSDKVYSVTEDRRGEMWIATAGGWNRFDRGAETFERYQNDPSDPGSLVHNEVYLTHEDRSGTLWVATEGGLGRFDRRTESFTNYTHDPGIRDQGGGSGSLSYDSVTGLHEDPEGIFWLTTGGGGLNRFDPDGERFTHFTTRDGLASDSLTAVLADGDGDLWLSSYRGLSRFDPRSATFTNYDIDDGLQSNEFNTLSAYSSPRGELYFGGVGGFNRFRPGEIRPSSYAPPVVLTAFRKFDRRVELERAVDEVEQVILSHRENFFSFEFAALDYTKPAGNRYAYKLEGFDQDWVASGTRRYASYTNLDGGHYTFRVKGSNGDGRWSGQQASIEVIVTAPPWKTWWAYSLYALAATLLVAGYNRHRMAAHNQALARQRREVVEQRREAARLRSIDQEREQALTERQRFIGELKERNAELALFNYTVSHDLKNPLVTIKNFLGRLRRDAAAGKTASMDRDLRRIESAADRMRQLLDDLLELSRVGLQADPPENLRFGELAGEAIDRLADEIAERGVEVVIQADLPEVSGDRDRLLEVMVNLLSNALKFMGAQQAPRVEVGARLDGANGKGWVLFVRDNGIGIEPAYHHKVFGLFERLDLEQEGTGVGLALVKRIVEVHGGRVWIESQGLGRGSTFCFTLPRPSPG